jgi:8-oxo-dGTP pyrophosphatase MutT (NUDIX family)
MELQRALEPEELAQLTLRWGAMPLREAALTVDAPFLTGKNQLLTNRGRRAEICYVMHRGDVAKGILLHIKTFYPDGAFRLPTGGIHTGELVEATLVREIYEETGLTVGTAHDQVKVERFLGVLSYDLFHRQLGPVAFATYHFLVQMPADGELNPQDDDESIGGWKWCTPDELMGVADLLDGVYRRSETWADWGHFRALSHRFVAEMVTA